MKDLKERYIYAVTRHLPRKMQADVEQELDSLITEMSAQRSLEDVLTELGNPDELAVKYSGSERTSLISGVYLLMYKRVLLIALPIVAGVLAAIAVIGAITGDTVPVFAIPIAGIGGLISGTIHAFAIITIIFAILDYKKVDLRDGDPLADLPEVPRHRHKFSISDPIAEIVLSVVFIILFLGVPQVMGWRFSGEWVPVFDIAVLRSLWYLILLWAGLSIGTEVYKLMLRQYTMRLAVAVTAANVIIAICAAVIFGNSDIVNPQLLYHAEYAFAGIEPAMWIYDNILTQNHFILPVIIIFGLVIEAVYTFIKAAK